VVSQIQFYSQGLIVVMITDQQQVLRNLMSRNSNMARLSTITCSRVMILLKT